MSDAPNAGRQFEPSFVEKIVALHDALSAASVRHAFGGALALAYFTADPRATADIDLNVSLDAARVQEAFDALPPGVIVEPRDAEVVHRTDQVRLWWGRTPVDLFFRASAFHDGVANRAVQREFGGRRLPFLSAHDLAVFKALFDRPKDWLDIAAMRDFGAIDLDAVAATVTELLGADGRAERLRRLA